VWQFHRPLFSVNVLRRLRFYLFLRRLLNQVFASEIHLGHFLEDVFLEEILQLFGGGVCSHGELGRFEVGFLLVFDWFLGYIGQS